MFNKSRVFFIIIIILISLSACGSKANTKTPKGINNTVKAMAASVNNKDIESFLNLIDKDNKEFYAEEKHWFDDIKNLNIEHYSIQIDAVSIMEPKKFRVVLSQTGQLNGKDFSIRSTGVFKQIDGSYKFSDLDFNVTESEHFIIKYPSSLKQQAQSFTSFIDEAYSTVKSIYGYIPSDRTVIKMYDNNQVFNWYIKPSINFEMGGWYEYPESIKINMSKMRNYDRDKLKSRFVDVISHELTHRTNMIESNNNIPYWMAEGIATFVQNGGIIDTSEPEIDIITLEKVNLEKLSKNDEISAYYSSAYKIISRFIKKYGIQKLHKLITDLKQYPLQEKTGGQSIDESNMRFHETLSKYMSITFKELYNELSDVN